MLTSEAPHQGLARIQRTATGGVCSLAVVAFLLSYDALHQLAVASDVPRLLAWLWPLIVDGFIIVASLAVLHAVLEHRPSIYPWLLVLAFSGISVIFNVLHAPPTVVGRLVAAIPPLALVLSFELLMRQLRQRLTLPANESLPAVAAIPTTVPTHPVLPLRITTTPSRRNPHATTFARARQIHAEHLSQGQRLTGKTLGSALGISDGYARRLLRELTPEREPNSFAVDTA